MNIVQFLLLQPIFIDNVHIDKFDALRHIYPNETERYKYVAFFIQWK